MIENFGLTIEFDKTLCLCVTKKTIKNYYKKRLQAICFGNGKFFCKVFRAIKGFFFARRASDRGLFF